MLFLFFLPSHLSRPVSTSRTSTNTQPPSQNNETTIMPTFFDLLPNDIHDKIAHYLFSSTRYPSNHFCTECMIDAVADDDRLDTLLNYAKSGPGQSCAIASAMSEQLYITCDWRDERIVDWISTIANHLKTLHTSEASFFSFLGNAPALPKLERAVIKMRREELSLIQRSPNLSHLKVLIFDAYGWDGFVSTVGSLNLKELELIFIKEEAMRRLSRRELMNLAAACPTVKALCMDTEMAYLPQQVWSMIQGMPSLKCLRLNGYIEEYNIPFLETLEEIGLEKISDIGRATRFCSTVTRLCVEHCYNTEDIKRIKFLPNLKDLVISPIRRQERALIGVINQVEQLSMSWDHENCHHLFQRPQGLLCEVHPLYYEPDGQVLEEIVRSAKRLKSLHINKAIVSSDVVLNLLKIIGGRLEKFEISHDWQREPAPDRMERILGGVAQYCPNLKTLSFLEMPDISRPHWPIVATREQMEKCSRALEKITLGAPGFKSYRHVRSTILNRFTDVQPDFMTWNHMLELPRSCRDPYE